MHSNTHMIYLIHIDLIWSALAEMMRRVGERDAMTSHAEVGADDSEWIIEGKVRPHISFVWDPSLLRLN